MGYNSGQTCWENPVLSDRHRQALEKNLRMAMVLGGVFLLSLGMYWLVIFAMPPQTPMDPQTLKMLRIILTAMGFGDLAMTFLIKRAFLHDNALERIGSQGVPQLLSLLLRTNLVVFAMAEAIGVFGFVLAIMGDTSPLPTGLLALSAAGIALHWPRRDAWEKTLARAKTLNMSADTPES